MEEHDHLLIAKERIDRMHKGVSSQETFAHLLMVIAEELRVIRKQIGCFLNERTK